MSEQQQKDYSAFACSALRVANLKDRIGQPIDPMLVEDIELLFAEELKVIREIARNYISELKLYRS